MIDFRTEIWKIEEISKAIKDKTQDNTDLELMTSIQQIQNNIHAAYVNLLRLNG
jgi:hypothetical protein